MKLKSLVMSVVTAAALAACGGQKEVVLEPTAPPPSSSPRSHVALPADDASGFEEAEPSAEAEAPGRASESAQDPFFRGGSAQPSPKPRTRPGLATSWGETRESHVATSRFERENPTGPFAVARLFYNDRAGVNAMASVSGRSDFGDSGNSTLGGLVSVRLIDAMGRALQTFEVAGRDYVVGQASERYALHLQNHTGNRFEVVATVDGLDVIDGEEGSLEKRGYILSPFSTLAIDGFRQSMTAVAAFRFGSVGDAYASRKGKARNVGVIGVALFHERGTQFPLDEHEIRRRHDADPFPGRFATPPTGF